MTCGVAAVTERDQIRRLVQASNGTWNQMVNVCFALGADFAALLTTPIVASENDRAYFTPLFFGSARG